MSRIDFKRTCPIAGAKDISYETVRRSVSKFRPVFAVAVNGENHLLAKERNRMKALVGFLSR
jgi:hypothetical protein